MKLLDAVEISKDILYVRLRQFKYHDKSGKQLVYVLAEDNFIMRESALRARDGNHVTNPQEKATIFADYY